jgi:hypothetical protein
MADAEVIHHFDACNFEVEQEAHRYRDITTRMLTVIGIGTLNPAALWLGDAAARVTGTAGAGRGCAGPAPGPTQKLSLC